MKFTVIGYYEDNQQRFARTLEASDHVEAFARVANDAPEYGGDLLFVCALDADHNVFDPTDEQGAADVCAARDYPAEYPGWREEARELDEDEKARVDGYDDPQEAAYDFGLPVNAVRKHLETLEGGAA